MAMQSGQLSGPDFVHLMEERLPMEYHQDLLKVLVRIEQMQNDSTFTCHLEDEEFAYTKMSPGALNFILDTLKA